MTARSLREWRLTAAALDTAALVVVMGGAAFARFGVSNALHFVRPDAASLSAPWPLGVVIWLVAMGLSGLYSPTRCANGVEEARRIVTACLAAPGALVMMSVLLRAQPSRLWLAMSVVAAIPVVGLERRGLRWITSQMRSRGRWMSRAVIVGGFDAKPLLDTIDRDPTWGVTPVATCGLVWGELPEFGLEEVSRAARQNDASTVVVVAGSMSREQVRDTVAAADDDGLNILVVPGLDYELLHNLQLVALGHEPALALERPSLRAHQRFLKRTVDVAVSAVGLTLMSPVFALIAVLIRVDSSGPAIFVQRRIGRHGRVFNVYKFRTMIDGAHEVRAQFEKMNEYAEGLFKIKVDPRLTRFGRFLRRFSLDELPQLWNVLRGEMSLVGPRPALPEEVEAYETRMMRRLVVRPGMTGLWQVSGRNDLTYEDYVRLDLTYAQNWGLILDAYIMLRTLSAVVRSRGAY